MGYYINILKKGAMYELNNIRLQFSEKVGKLYYFYIYKLNSFGINYENTNLVVAYSKDEITYIKRVQDDLNVYALTPIGYDKSFVRY